MARVSLSRHGIAAAVIAGALGIAISSLMYAQDAPPIVREVSGVPACSTCIVRRVHLSTVHLPKLATQHVEQTEDAAIDSRGQIVVTEPERSDVRVFDRSGRFLRTLDADGTIITKPALRAVVGFGDTLFVTQAPLHQLLVFGPDGRFVRAAQLPPVGLFAFLPLRDGQIIISANPTPLQTPSRKVDTTLAIVAGAGGVLRWFGSLSEIPSKCAGCALRLLAPASGTPASFWAALPDEYRIQRWTDGGLLLEDQRILSADWFEGATALTPRPDFDARPRPTVSDIYDDGRGHLWVIGWVAAPNWAPVDMRSSLLVGQIGGVMIRRVKPTGIQIPDSSWQRLQHNYSTVVDVIDTKTGAVLARQRFENERLSEGGNGIVYSRTRNPDGTRQIDTYQLELLGTGNPKSGKHAPR